MSEYFRRKQAGRGENLRAGLVAGGLAATVAAVSFYLVRLLLTREPLEPLPPVDATGGSTRRGPEDTD